MGTKEDNWVIADTDSSEEKVETQTKIYQVFMNSNYKCQLSQFSVLHILEYCNFQNFYQLHIRMVSIYKGEEKKSNSIGKDCVILKARSYSICPFKVLITEINKRSIYDFLYLEINQNLTTE